MKREETRLPLLFLNYNDLGFLHSVFFKKQGARFLRIVGADWLGDCVSVKLREGHILSTSLQPSTIKVWKSLHFCPLFLEIYRRILHLWRRFVGKCRRHFKCDCLSIFVRSLQKWNQILHLLRLQRRWEKLPTSFVIK